MPSRPDVAPGSSPSVVDGTPSSRSAHSTLKRNRQRSTSPDFTPGPFAPRRDDDDPFRVRRSSALPPYVVKQYLAVETAAPIVTEEVERGVLGESTEREAEYLLDDGSQLAREEVRGVVGGAWKGSGDGEPEVHWRTVTVKQLAIEDVWIAGRSWTYQPAPPRISSNDPLIEFPAGAIRGKPVSDLAEWDRVEVFEAFSPIRSNSGRLHFPRQPATEAKTNPDRSTVLESPFNSQRETTGKSHATHPLRTPRTPTSRRKRSPSPYVFANDLPPWEWYFPADSEASLRGDGSQSQSVRESMRQSGGERQAVKGNDLTVGQIFPSAPTSVMELPTWVQKSPEAGSESFLTDASITDIAGVPPTHPSGKATDDGRQMHRMPVLLKDLDHAKFLEGSKKREKATKPPQQRGKKSGEEKRAAGGVDKRVRELQVGGKERNVRPIKEFLPLHMRVKHAEGKTDGNAEDVSMVDDSVVDDISFAESIQEDHAGDGGGEGIGDKKEQQMRKEKASLALGEVREAAISSSRPSASESTMTHLDERHARRGNEERFEAVYDTIPQPHTLDAPMESSNQPIPIPAEFFEPIPVLPPVHPFHPDLQHYIATSPHTRVTWLIPIHGAVTIDLPNTPALANFYPSAGHLALTDDEYRDMQKRHRGSSMTATSALANALIPVRPLIWTRELVLGLWNRLLRLRQLGRFGAIGLALALQPHHSRSNDRGSAVMQHQCVPAWSVNKGAMLAPMRPEISDHIKLTCDLRYAMAVRCVLKGLELEGGATSVPGNTTAKRGEDGQYSRTLKSGPTRQLRPTVSSATSSTKSRLKQVPFRGVKLCLVGEHGEVLLVV